MIIEYNLELPNNGNINVSVNPITKNIYIDYSDRWMKRTDTIGHWDKETKRWYNFGLNKMFKLCKQYPQLKRLILKAQNYKEVTPVILQWNCFKRKFNLTIHNLTK